MNSDDDEQQRPKTLAAQQQQSNNRWALEYVAGKVESAQQYRKRGKHHTSMIIAVGIVNGLQEMVFDKYTTFTNASKRTLYELLVQVEALLDQKCKQDDDMQIAKAAKKALTSILRRNNIVVTDSQEDREDSTTECSCDDCENGTCSTNGPLGGCRRARTRD
jgi:hypothetical protein